MTTSIVGHAHAMDGIRCLQKPTYGLSGSDGNHAAMFSLEMKISGLCHVLGADEHLGHKAPCRSHNVIRAGDSRCG
eukprot:356544-Chlamydomonas_euryale.AAC.1